MAVHKIQPYPGNKTFSPRLRDFRPRSPLAPQWLLVDVKTQSLGRAASQIVPLLRGKHKAHFSPHLDLGDYVVVINAAHVRLSGNKLREKLYYHHTGYPGGLKSANAQRLLEENPTELMRLAIKRMLPKNILGRRILHTKLKLYPHQEHPHEAQQPQNWLLIGQQSSDATSANKPPADKPTPDAAAS